MNATISFLILAAVVYFLVVLPYTKAKERYFPSDAEGPTEVRRLLTEIRDSPRGSLISLRKSPSEHRSGGLFA